MVIPPKLTTLLDRRGEKPFPEIVTSDPSTPDVGLSEVRITGVAGCPVVTVNGNGSLVPWLPVMVTFVWPGLRPLGTVTSRPFGPAPATVAVALPKWTVLLPAGVSNPDPARKTGVPGGPLAGLT